MTSLLLAILLPLLAPTAPATAPAPTEGAALSTEGAQSLAASKAAFKADQCQPALDAATKVLAEQPDHHDALYIAGSCEAQLGKLDEAEKHLRALADASPSYPLVHYRLGMVAFSEAEGFAKADGGTDQAQSKYADAASEFETELQRDPSQVGSASSRAIALARAQKYDESIQAHQAWIALAPDKPEAYVSLAAAYALADHPEEALATLDKIPNADEAATKAALASLMKQFLDQHNAKAALPFLERAASFEPDSPHSQAMLVEGYAGALDYDKAVAALKKLMASNPAPDDLERAGNAIRATIGDGKSSVSVPGVEPPVALKLPPTRGGGGKENVERTVLVLAHVSPRGDLEDALVVPDKDMQDIKSSGAERDALEAVRKTKFTPGTKDGAPSEMWTVVAIKVRGGK